MRLGFVASILAATAFGSSPSSIHEGSLTKSSNPPTRHSYDRALVDNNSVKKNIPSVVAPSEDRLVDLPFRVTPPAMGNGNTRIDENKLRKQMKLKQETYEFERNLLAASSIREGSLTKSSNSPTRHSYDRALIDNESVKKNISSVVDHSEDEFIDLPFRVTPPALGDGDTRIDEVKLRRQMELKQETYELERNLRAASSIHERSLTKSSYHPTRHNYDRALVDNESVKKNISSVVDHSEDGFIDLPFRVTPPAMGNGNTRIDENKLRRQMQLKQSAYELERNLRADQAELRRQAYNEQNNLGPK